MSGYIGTQPVPQATQHRESFTATSSQTSFATAGYTPQFLDVYLNGVHLLDGTDYTASNGSDVVLTTGAATGDVVEVVSYTPFEVADQTFTGAISMTDGLTVDNDGATVLTVDRATSDGTIIDVQKDGSTVGSIGTNSNRPYFEKDAAGGFTISSSGGNPIILPTSGAGALSDSLANIGAAAYRFKDLYLSGGVYLGGTGSANKLDDYEEGTWTPTVSNNGNLSGTATVNSALYRKVGRLVHIEVRLSGLTITSSSTETSLISNLPFAASNAVHASVGACYWSGPRSNGFTVDLTGSNSTQIFIALTPELTSSGATDLYFAHTYASA